jgi:hypothetical protein
VLAAIEPHPVPGPQHRARQVPGYVAAILLTQIRIGRDSAEGEGCRSRQQRRGDEPAPVAAQVRDH